MWIDHAQLITLLRDSASYQENGPCPRFRPDNHLNSIDPYRLKRARELRVVRIKPSRFRVTGGSDPHIVRQLNGNYQCDCRDYQKGQRQCKHVLAVRLRQRDPMLQPQAEQLKPLGVPHAEWNLLALWTEDSDAPLPAVRGWR
ncbi:MAG: SWIM zinc finger family protein [Candidatus Competibacteraceae bacterium]